MSGACALDLGGLPAAHAHHFGCKKHRNVFSFAAILAFNRAVASHPNPRIAQRIEALPSQGRYTFTVAELLEGAESPVALRAALRRLRVKGHVVSPRRGFFVVVPPEYRATGSPPASWFLDDLMGYLEQPYYLGLLSAAALHGAAHQRPQVTQVVTDVTTRPISVGRVRIQFFRRRAIQQAAVERRRTETGTMVVATPETTLFDLVRHLGSVGHLSNAATVVGELGESLTPEGLVRAAGLARTPEIQRAGYLLERMEHEEAAAVLEQHLRDRRVRPVPLAPGRPCPPPSREARAERWTLILNDVVEPDL